MPAVKAKPKKTRDYTSQRRPRVCAVCKKECASTLEIRTHKCTANYHLRMGYVWNQQLYKYVDPAKLVVQA